MHWVAALAPVLHLVCHHHHCVPKPGCHHLRTGRWWCY